MIAYKLTDQDMKTYKGFQWALNKPVETDGKGGLCSGGWLHFYEHPLLAVFHNPIHAAFKNPRLFRAKVSGKCLKDRQLKVGYTKAVLIKEESLPTITLNQRIAYAILCTREVYKEKSFIKWANNWLNNKDRTVDAAYAAADTAHAAADIADAVAHATNAAADTAHAAAHATNATYAAIYAAKAANTAAAAADTIEAPLNLLRLAKKAMKY